MTGSHPAPGPRPPHAPTDAPAGHRSVVLPVALIAVGALLLLSALQVFPAGTAAALAQWWPLALLAWGVELAPLRFSTWGWRVALVCLMVGSGLWLALIVRPILHSQTVLVDRPAGVEQATLKVQVGRAHLILTRGRASAPLLAGTVQLLAGEQLEQRSSVNLGAALVQLTTRHAGPVSVSAAQAATWRLGLAPDVPLTLALTTGVGRADIDLRGLLVRDLTVTAGVGVSVVVLPESGPLRVRVTGGVGDITLRVPPQLPVRVQMTPGLGAISAGPGFTRQGQVFIHAGRPTAAPARLADVQITGGVGHVRVETYP